MTPNDKIISLAKYEAFQSRHRFRVGAIIYRGPKRIVLGRGYNNAEKTHPKSPHPFKSIHAEFGCFLHSYRLRNDLSESSIYVHRLLSNGDSGIARPCGWCAGLLERIQINEIYFSMEQNKVAGVKGRWGNVFMVY